MQGHDPRYGQQQPYNPPPPAQQPSQQQGWGANLGGGFGGQLGGAAGKFAMPGAFGKVSGLPAPISFILGLVAVAIALVFDVIFLKVSIPGVGGYAWYLTTALSFAGAGWASVKWTRASKTVAMTAVVFAGIVYGLADVGLGLVLEGTTMSTAIVLGAQGVGIALFTGFGGVFKAMRERG